MKTGRYSLKELLTHNEIEQIIIPEIQRDYVWEISNVAKLIDDIIKSYEKRKSHQFEIKINGELEVNDSVNQFLTKEYERLKYHQKLGFIYAYHDRDYAGKFFLIDGQQRLTTLFLILLFLYKALGKTQEFRSRYFINRIPKVNYKVREESNDFMQLMIESELNDKSYEDSEQFYKSEYLKDVTISHLITNYNHIKQQIGSVSNKAGFLEYLEDFVEVNYFDTHLSEQGEQLYIYMNSRGEQLSFQEIARAELMQKINEPKKKIELGNEWEEWQNFFWTKRDKNENADKGFEEFLKWSAIIHMGLHNDVDLVNFVIPRKELTVKQTKENYIKTFNNENIMRSQKEALFKYQVNYLDFEFLKSLFDALHFLYEKKTKYIPVFEGWLSSEINIIDYVLLLPLIQYVAQNKWADESSKLADTEKVAMFLKNISYFEAVGKNPDTATLDAISIISQLNDGKKDVDFLKDIPNVTKTIITDTELQKLDYLLNSNPERRIREEFIWNISLDHEFNSFLMGDISVLFRCLNVDTSSMLTDLELLEDYRKVLREIIFINKNSDNLKMLMLAKFDYLIKAGSGNNINKFSFIGNGNTWEVWREWKTIFEKESFIELLIWLKNNQSLDLQNHFDKAKDEFVYNDWISVFVNHYELLVYCTEKKILRQDEHRILLLEKTNYSVNNSKEIQCALLETGFKKQGMWIHENNCCVLEFEYDDEIQFNRKNAFAIDIVYHATSFVWSFTFFHRNKNILELINIDSSETWKTISEAQGKWLEKTRITKVDDVLYKYDVSLSLEKNNELMKEAVDQLFIDIEILFKQV